MNYWTYKKANFKAADGLQVYEGYLFGEFMGYYHKKKMYQLVSKKTLKGTELKEKFIGYGHELFHRRIDGVFVSWDEWKQFQLNFDNELKKEPIAV